MTPALDCLPPREPPPARAFGTLANLAAAYPLLLLGLLYGQWLLAVWVLGHPPRPSVDDPKDLAGVGWLHGATTLALICFVPVFLVALVLHARQVVLQRHSRARSALRLTAIVAIWLATLVLLRLDPGQVVDWWLD